MKHTARRTWTLLRDTVSLWTSKNAFQFAGAIAFYTLFSLAPLMIILVTGAGIIFGEEAARGEIAVQIEALVGPQAAQAVEDAVDQARIERSGLLPTLLGIGLLLFGATTVFAQLQGALNHLWDVAPRPAKSGILLFLRTRLLSLGLVLVIGFLLLVSFALTVSVAAFVRFGSEWIPVPNAVAWITDLAFSVAVVTILFGLMFKVLPDVNLRWRDMWQGALLAAVLFAVGQYGISFYLTQAAPGSAYGAAGSLVIVLMWVYYSTLILLLGAAFTRTWLRQKGGMIRPSAIAVRIRTEVVEEEGPGRATGKPSPPPGAGAEGR
jgi:membrane protein